MTESLLGLSLPPIATANLELGLRDTRVSGKQKEKTLVLTKGPIEVLLLIKVIGKIPQKVRPFCRRNWLGHNRQV